ncbi:hypothetical protein ACTHGU_00580 [Chitinophagaceae bacterium MMS25-I14]
MAQIDSERIAGTRRIDSIRAARAEQYKKEGDENAQRMLQQTRENMAAYEARKEAASGSRYKWLAVLGRYVIIFLILGVISWWKKKKDKSKPEGQV